MKSEFNEERPLDLDEQNASWSEWDKRMRRIAHNLCLPKQHYKPGEKNKQGDKVEYCDQCYRDARMVTDLWVEVFEYEGGAALARAQATNFVQFIPISDMHTAAAGLMKPTLRRALGGYGVL